MVGFVSRAATNVGFFFSILFLFFGLTVMGECSVCAESDGALQIGRRKTRCQSIGVVLVDR